MTATDHAPTGTDRTSNHRQGAARAWLQAGVLAAALSVAANLVVLAAARAADASMVVVDGGTSAEITAASVATSSAVPVIVGLVVVALLALRWSATVRLAQVVGGAFALLSVAGPLAADTDGGTAAALAIMHVVVGGAFVLALEVARRQAVAPR